MAQEKLERIRPRRKGPIVAELKRRDALFKEKAVERWQNSFPAIHKGYSLDDIKHERWGGRLSAAEVVQVLKYVKSGGSRFLLLQGPEGTGKSTLGVTIISDLVRQTGHAATHHVVPRLLASFSHPRDGEDPLRDASRAPILMLDDMGAANSSMTDHQQRSLWSLIDARWSNPELRTIITTNMSQGNQREGVGLQSWLGPPAWARVADDLTQINVKGESFRGGMDLD